MAYKPAVVSFNYDGPAFQSVVIRLRQVSDNVALAGAEIGVPPVVDGKYAIELAVHALTPDSYPALIGVQVVATVVVKATSGVESAEIATAPFVFQLPDPQNVVAV